MRVIDYLGAVVGHHRRQAVAPRLLTCLLTYRCNCRCVMCDSWQLRNQPEMELSDLRLIFKQLPHLDMVRLSGGEPFLRRDLPEIVELAQEQLQPLMLHITSNGLLTRRIIRLVEQRRPSYPLLLLISIDAVGKRHDSIRGVPGAFDRAVETIRALAPRRDQLRLRLLVNQTIIDDDGLAHYRQLRSLLQPLEVPLSVVFAYDQSATYSTDRGSAVPVDGDLTTFGRLSAGHCKQLLDEIEGDLTRFRISEQLARRYYLHGVRSRLLLGKSSPNPGCVALNAHLRILPNGDVPTCQFNGAVVGNLVRQLFTEVWYDTEIDRQRQWVRSCPGCWAECEVLPSAVYTGDLLRHALSLARRADSSLAR